MPTNAQTLSVLFLVFCISCIFTAPVVSSQTMMPHAVFGTVQSTEGTHIAEATVTIRNQRTGDTLTETTDSLGQYQTDLNSMPSGYVAGDVIVVSAAYGNLSGSSSISVSTNALDQCDITIAPAAESEPFTILGLDWIIVVAIAAALIVGILAAAFYLTSKPDETKENKKGRRRN